MIDIQALQLTHKKDLRSLLDRLDLTIHTGDKLALIGEEGNGKSTLLKLLFDESLVSDYIDWIGRMIKNYSRAGYLPQSLPQELECLPLYDYFFQDEEIDYAILYRLAGQLNIDSSRLTSSQPLGSLSGGERIKIQLLKILSCPHDILFLDEPSNDMDLETLEWLESYIAASKETIVFISHDPEFLSKTATRILHIELLRKKGQPRVTVANIDYENYLSQRELQIKRQTQQAINDQKEYAKKEARFQRVHDSVQHALREMHDSTQGRLLAKKMHVIKAQGKRMEKESDLLTQRPDQETAIDLFFDMQKKQAMDRVLVQFEKETLVQSQKVLIPSFSWTLRTGQKVAITGANGIGKSSLLKILRDQCQEMTSLKMAYMPQNYQEELDLQQSPLEFLAPTRESKERERIRSRLASLQFTKEEIQHAMADLSGGQLAKILLLQIVLTQPDILLLDEPTRNLSPVSHEQVVKLFQDFKGTLVCVSHDRRFMSQVCEQVYELTIDGLKEQ